MSEGSVESYGAGPSEIPLRARIVSVLLRLASLRDHLQNLRREDFPTSGSVGLTDLFIRITYLHEWFLSQRLNADEPKDKEYRQHFAPTELEYLRDIEIQASLLSLNSRFIESSKREYSTTELPATLEALVRTLGPEVGVIVRPQNEYGYQYNELVITSIENNSFSLKPLLGAPTPPFTEESLLEGLPRRIGILTFPKIEANNVLLHSFGMAHELGHLVDEVLGFSGISPSRGDSLTVAKSDASASALLRTSEQTFVRTSRPSCAMEERLGEQAE